MSKIDLNKKVYSKYQYSKIIDTSFTFLKPPSGILDSTYTPPSNDPNAGPAINEFFANYNQIFFKIPKSGPNSHQTLIEQSSEYIGDNSTNNVVQALIEEINILQRQNLELNQQLINLQLPSGSLPNVNM